MQEKFFEDGTAVEVIDVKKLCINIHNAKGIKVEYENCNVYKHKKDTIVHIIGESAQKASVHTSGSQPGIVSGGDITFGNVTGQFAIGNNIIQSGGSKPVSKAVAIITVPAGTVIEVEDVSMIVIDNSTRKQVTIKEVD